MTREEGEDDDDLGLVTVPLKLKLGMNLCTKLLFTAWDRPRSSHRGSRMTYGDADDSGESSPPTSMSTMSVAPLSMWTHPCASCQHQARRVVVVERHLSPTSSWELEQSVRAIILAGVMEVSEDLLEFAEEKRPRIGWHVAIIGWHELCDVGLVDRDGLPHRLVQIVPLVVSADQVVKCRKRIALSERLKETCSVPKRRS